MRSKNKLLSSTDYNPHEAVDFLKTFFFSLSLVRFWKSTGSIGLSIFINFFQKFWVSELFWFLWNLHFRSKFIFKISFERVTFYNVLNYQKLRLIENLRILSVLLCVERLKSASLVTLLLRHCNSDEKIKIRWFSMNWYKRNKTKKSET